MPLPFWVADRDAGAVRIIDDGEAGVPDPRPASWEKIRELPVPAMTFVRQPTVEDAIPGFQSGNDGTGLVELCVDFTYTLVRSPDDRAAPENLRELDEGTRRALEELPYRNRPNWVVEMAERLRFPQLHEAVRTSWHREEHERSTVDAILLHHVNHVLRNYVRAERGWDGRLGSLNPAPDVTAAAIQRDARVVVDGRMLDGIRIDTDPHVYGLGAALPSGGVLTAAETDDGRPTAVARRHPGRRRRIRAASGADRRVGGCVARDLARCPAVCRHTP
ncbi:hypothetical protein [Microbacterium rhizosphaerae]|uniref:Uncharacterized protein n=1 Tax=Microbacterium rhizosphaerae TaxID=1678237 RepID=A0ABZ0SI21_9MICO|nr:hypothetical protein [Microbacterium rhizosphaerae]WPR88934.1 hypothetical protein SM116_14365 [Microbacterium rhizosphaerae]